MTLRCRVGTAAAHRKHSPEGEVEESQEGEQQEPEEFACIGSPSWPLDTLLTGVPLICSRKQRQPQEQQAQKECM